MESTVVWIEGSKSAETCALYARMFRHQFINTVRVNLPSQQQLPGLYSTFRIIISRGAKLDILVLMAAQWRKYFLQPFVELLGKCCQILGGVEFGMLQLLWLRVE